MPSGKVFREKMGQTTSFGTCKIYTLISGLLRNIQAPLRLTKLCLAGHVACFTGVFPGSDLAFIRN